MRDALALMYEHWFWTTLWFALLGGWAREGARVVVNRERKPERGRVYTPPPPIAEDRPHG